ncbi:hypothetical protein [Paenibacillus marinisediminis]
MNFEQAHQVFLERHLASRSGERKGRLLRGHQYAEKLLLQNVWWPLFGNLDHLHPEYEVYDWNRKSQFLDFAFLPSFGQFGIECDGFQSHVKDMDREAFSYALNRDTFLTGMGWKMIHFSFDDVKHRPEVCRMLLQLNISPYLIRSQAATTVSSAEQDVLRLAWNLGRPIRPKDVIDHYKVNYRTARKWLQSMVEKGLLRPIDQGKYTCYYEMKEGIAELLL